MRLDWIFLPMENPCAKFLHHNNNNNNNNNNNSKSEIDLQTSKWHILL